MKIKTVIILLYLITQVLQTHGLIQLKNSLAISDSPLLKKILQLVDAVTSDEQLLQVTLKLLQSLCACMRETLEAKENKFYIGNHSLDFNKSNSTDSKVFELYRNIYNNTCFNLRQELINRTHEFIVDDETDFLNHTNCGKVEKDESHIKDYDIDESPAVKIPRLENILFKALIQTKDLHEYRLRRYDLFGKSAPHKKNVLLQSLIVILTLHPDKQEISSRKNNVDEKDLNSTLYRKSPINVDIIDTKHNQKLKKTNESTKAEIISDCNLKSLYKFLTESEKNNLIKVYKFIRKKPTIKIYIELKGQNYTDFINICCEKGSVIPQCNQYVINNFIKHNILPTKSPDVSYIKTITKIKNLVKQYENKLNDTTHPNISIISLQNEKKEENTVENTSKLNRTNSDNYKENYIHKLVTNSNSSSKFGEVTRAIILLNDFVSKQTTQTLHQSYQIDLDKTYSNKQQWTTLALKGEQKENTVTHSTINTESVKNQDNEYLNESANTPYLPENRENIELIGVTLSLDKYETKLDLQQTSTLKNDIDNDDNTKLYKVDVIQNSSTTNHSKTIVKPSLNDNDKLTEFTSSTFINNKITPPTTPDLKIALNGKKYSEKYLIEQHNTNTSDSISTITPLTLNSVENTFHYSLSNNIESFTTNTPHTSSVILLTDLETTTNQAPTEYFTDLSTLENAVKKIKKGQLDSSSTDQITTLPTLIPIFDSTLYGGDQIFSKIENTTNMTISMNSTNVAGDYATNIPSNTIEPTELEKGNTNYVLSDEMRTTKYGKVTENIKETEQTSISDDSEQDNVIRPIDTKTSTSEFLHTKNISKSTMDTNYLNTETNILLSELETKTNQIPKEYLTTDQSNINYTVSVEDFKKAKMESKYNTTDQITTLSTLILIFNSTLYGGDQTLSKVKSTSVMTMPIKSTYSTEEFTNNEPVDKTTESFASEKSDTNKIQSTSDLTIPMNFTFVTGGFTNYDLNNKTIESTALEKDNGDYALSDEITTGKYDKVTENIKETKETSMSDDPDQVDVMRPIDTTTSTSEFFHTKNVSKTMMNTKYLNTETNILLSELETKTNQIPEEYLNTDKSNLDYSVSVKDLKKAKTESKHYTTDQITTLSTLNSILNSTLYDGDQTLSKVKSTSVMTMPIKPTFTTQGYTYNEPNDKIVESSVSEKSDTNKIQSTSDLTIPMNFTFVKGGFTTYDLNNKTNEPTALQKGNTVYALTDEITIKHDNVTENIDENEQTSILHDSEQEEKTKLTDTKTLTSEFPYTKNILETTKNSKYLNTEINTILWLELETKTNQTPKEYLTIDQSNLEYTVSVENLKKVNTESKYNTTEQIITFSTMMPVFDRTLYGEDQALNKVINTSTSVMTMPIKSTYTTRSYTNNEHNNKTIESSASEKGDASYAISDDKATTKYNSLTENVNEIEQTLISNKSGNTPATKNISETITQTKYKNMETNTIHESLTTFPMFDFSALHNQSIHAHMKDINITDRVTKVEPVSFVSRNMFEEPNEQTEQYTKVTKNGMTKTSSKETILSPITQHYTTIEAYNKTNSVKYIDFVNIIELFGNTTNAVTETSETKSKNESDMTTRLLVNTEKTKTTIQDTVPTFFNDMTDEEIAIHNTDSVISKMGKPVKTNFNKKESRNINTTLPSTILTENVVSTEYVLNSVNVTCDPIHRDIRDEENNQTTQLFLTTISSIPSIETVEEIYTTPTFNKYSVVSIPEFKTVNEYMENITGFENSIKSESDDVITEKSTISNEYWTTNDYLNKSGIKPFTKTSLKSESIVLKTNKNGIQEIMNLTSDMPSTHYDLKMEMKTTKSEIKKLSKKPLKNRPKIPKIDLKAIPQTEPVINNLSGKDVTRHHTLTEKNITVKKEELLNVNTRIESIPKVVHSNSNQSTVLPMKFISTNSSNSTKIMPREAKFAHEHETNISLSDLLVMYNGTFAHEKLSTSRESDMTQNKNITKGYITILTSTVAIESSLESVTHTTLKAKNTKNTAIPFTVPGLKKTKKEAHNNTVTDDNFMIGKLTASLTHTESTTRNVLYNDEINTKNTATSITVSGLKKTKKEAHNNTSTDDNIMIDKLPASPTHTESTTRNVSYNYEISNFTNGTRLTQKRKEYKYCTENCLYLETKLQEMIKKVVSNNKTEQMITTDKKTSTPKVLSTSNLLSQTQSYRDNKKYNITTGSTPELINLKQNTDIEEIQGSTIITREPIIPPSIVSTSATLSSTDIIQNTTINKQTTISEMDIQQKLENPNMKTTQPTLKIFKSNYDLDSQPHASFTSPTFKVNNVTEVEVSDEHNFTPKSDQTDFASKPFNKTYKLVEEKTGIELSTEKMKSELDKMQFHYESEVTPAYYITKSIFDKSPSAITQSFSYNPNGTETILVNNLLSSFVTNSNTLSKNKQKSSSIFPMENKTYNKKANSKRAKPFKRKIKSDNPLAFELNIRVGVEANKDGIKFSVLDEKETVHNRSKSRSSPSSLTNKKTNLKNRNSKKSETLINLKEKFINETEKILTTSLNKKNKDIVLENMNFWNIWNRKYNRDNNVSQSLNPPAIYTEMPEQGLAVGNTTINDEMQTKMIITSSVVSTPSNYNNFTNFKHKSNIPGALINKLAIKIESVNKEHLKKLKESLNFTNNENTNSKDILNFDLNNHSRVNMSGINNTLHTFGNQEYLEVSSAAIFDAKNETIKSKVRSKEETEKQLHSKKLIKKLINLFKSLKTGRKLTKPQLRKIKNKFLKYLSSVSRRKNRANVSVNETSLAARFMTKETLVQKGVTISSILSTTESNPTDLKTSNVITPNSSDVFNTTEVSKPTQSIFNTVNDFIMANVSLETAIEVLSGVSRHELSNATMSNFDNNSTATVTNKETDNNNMSTIVTKSSNTDNKTDKTSKHTVPTTVKSSTASKSIFQSDINEASITFPLTSSPLTITMVPPQIYESNDNFIQTSHTKTIQDLTNFTILDRILESTKNDSQNENLKIETLSTRQMLDVSSTSLPWNIKSTANIPDQVHPISTSLGENIQIDYINTSIPSNNVVISTQQMLNDISKLLSEPQSANITTNVSADYIFNTTNNFTRLPDSYKPISKEKQYGYKHVLKEIKNKINNHFENAKHFIAKLSNISVNKSGEITHFLKTIDDAIKTPSTMTQYLNITTQSPNQDYSIKTVDKKINNQHSSFSILGPKIYKEINTKVQDIFKTPSQLSLDNQHLIPVSLEQKKSHNVDRGTENDKRLNFNKLKPVSINATTITLQMKDNKKVVKQHQSVENLSENKPSSKLFNCTTSENIIMQDSIDPPLISKFATITKNALLNPFTSQNLLNRSIGNENVLIIKGPIFTQYNNNNVKNILKQSTTAPPDAHNTISRGVSKKSNNSQLLNFSVKSKNETDTKIKIIKNDKNKTVYGKRIGALGSIEQNRSENLQNKTTRNNTKSIYFLKSHDGEKNISVIHAPNLTQVKVTKLNSSNKTTVNLKPEVQKLLLVSRYQEKLRKDGIYQNKTMGKEYHSNSENGIVKNKLGVQIFSSRVHRLNNLSTTTPAVTKSIKYNTYRPLTNDDLELLKVHEQVDDERHSQIQTFNNSSATLKNFGNNLQSESKRILKAVNYTEGDQIIYVENKDNDDKDLHLALERKPIEITTEKSHFILETNINSHELTTNRVSPPMIEINTNRLSMNVNRYLDTTEINNNSVPMEINKNLMIVETKKNKNSPSTFDNNRDSLEDNKNSPLIVKNKWNLLPMINNFKLVESKNLPLIILENNREAPAVIHKNGKLVTKPSKSDNDKSSRTMDAATISNSLTMFSYRLSPTELSEKSNFLMTEFIQKTYPTIKTTITSVPTTERSKTSQKNLKTRKKIRPLKAIKSKPFFTFENNEKPLSMTEKRRNAQSVLPIKTNTHSNIIKKKFKKMGSSEEMLLDTFGTRNPYAVKIREPKAPEAKRIKIPTRRKAVMTMNTQDFLSQHRFVTPRSVKQTKTKPYLMFLKPQRSIPKSMLGSKFEHKDKVANTFEHPLRPKTVSIITSEIFQKNLNTHRLSKMNNRQQKMYSGQNIPDIIAKTKKAKANYMFDMPLLVTTLKPKFLKDRADPLKKFIFSDYYNNMKITRRPVYSDMPRVSKGLNFYGDHYSARTSSYIPQESNHIPIESSEDLYDSNYSPSPSYRRKNTEHPTTETARTPRRGRTIFFLSPTVTDWWLDDMYLKVRLPLPINSNPGMVFPRRHFAKMEEVADLGALFIDDLLDYKEMLDRGELPLERATSREKGQPLCMEQFYRLLGVCRIPEVGKDRLELPLAKRGAEESEELVVVACRNYFYPIPVKAADRGRLTPGEMQAQLLHAMVDAAGAPQAPRVGLLTSMNRDQWARAREQLIKDEMNRMNLELISRALCILCLDEGGGDRADTDADTNAMLRAMHGAGTRYHSANRWFDKTVQLIISSDGTVGMCYEHSAAEGVAVVRLAERALARAEVADRPAPPPALLPAPQAMKWNVTSDVQRTIETAARELDRAISDLDHKVYTYRGYGREFMKSCRTSPDVYIQLAMQYAYYKMYGCLVTTYESASLRRFRNGRVDNIRSAHGPALAWAAAMCTAETPPLNDGGDEGQKKVSFNLYGEQKKLELFEEAARKQTSIMEANILGKGIDNHLLGLREAARETLGELPPVFCDTTYKQMIEFKLSTSQVTTTTDGTFMGYGAVCPDGYGCSYNPKKDSVIFCISSFTSSSVTNTEAFRQSLEEALDSMKLMFQARKVDN